MALRNSRDDGPFVAEHHASLMKVRQIHLHQDKADPTHEMLYGTVS